MDKDTKRLFNCDPELTQVDIVCIFISTLKAFQRRCHEQLLHISAVPHKHTPFDKHPHIIVQLHGQLWRHPGHVIGCGCKPLHLNPRKFQIVITYCLQDESIFVLAVASKICLSTVHRDTLRLGWHDCAYDKAANRTNNIIETGTTPCTKTSRNFLLLLFAWKMKCKFWGVIYDINNTPHTVVCWLHGNHVDLHNVIHGATRKVAQHYTQADLCANIVWGMMYAIPPSTGKKLIIQPWLKNGIQTLKRCLCHAVYTMEEQIWEAVPNLVKLFVWQLILGSPR